MTQLIVPEAVVVPAVTGDRHDVILCCRADLRTMAPTVLTPVGLVSKIEQYLDPGSGIIPKSRF